MDISIKHPRLVAEVSRVKLESDYGENLKKYFPPCLLPSYPPPTPQPLHNQDHASQIETPVMHTAGGGGRESGGEIAFPLPTLVI